MVRKRCSKCEKFFDTDKNFLHICRYHPGHLLYEEYKWSCCGTILSNEGCFSKLHEKDITQNLPFIFLKKGGEDNQEIVDEIFKINKIGTVLEITEIPDELGEIKVSDIFSGKIRKEKITSETLRNFRTSDKNDVFMIQEIENLRNTKDYCYSSNTDLLLNRTQFLREKDKEPLIAISISSQFLFC